MNTTNTAEINAHKILCIRYIAKLAKDFGKDITERYLLSQLICFSIDKSNDIKKEVLISIPSLCDITSSDFINSKIYEIIKRVYNESPWNLRKICVNVVAKIIKIYKEKYIEEKSINSPNINREDISATFSAKNFVGLIEKFCKDEDKNVRYTFLEHIGEIISPLNKDELSKEVFNFYKTSVEKYYENQKKKLPFGATGPDQVKNNQILLKRMSSGGSSSSSTSRGDQYEDDDLKAQNEYDKVISDDEISYFFAYNFPAILYCYGKEYWPELKTIYFDFCFEENFKVRCPIIASFHEIAKIIGQEITENELLPVYDKFLESNDKYIQKLSIKNLPKILLLVDKSKKERYYKYFEAVSIFIDNTGSKLRNFNFINWKNKLKVVESILCYFNLYENDIIYKSILPQCIIFSLDTIYKIRKTSSIVMATVIEHLYNDNYKKESLFKILESYAFHKKFQMRINFIKMCKIFLKNEKLFKEKIFDLLQIIAYKDKIIDVRIALSKTLRKLLAKGDKFILHNNDNIHKLVLILLKDDKPVINKIFKNFEVNEDIKCDEINRTDEEYKKIFKGNNKYFIEEFGIENEKKDNKLFLGDKSQKESTEDNKEENKNKEADNKNKEENKNNEADNKNTEENKNKEVDNKNNENEKNTEENKNNEVDNKNKEENKNESKTENMNNIKNGNDVKNEDNNENQDKNENKEKNEEKNDKKDENSNKKENIEEGAN